MALVAEKQELDGICCKRCDRQKIQQDGATNDGDPERVNSTVKDKSKALHSDTVLRRVIRFLGGGMVG